MWPAAPWGAAKLPDDLGAGRAEVLLVAEAPEHAQEVFEIPLGVGILLQQRVVEPRLPSTCLDLGHDEVHDSCVGTQYQHGIVCLL